ncbi:MAG: hypothetical protein K9J37_08885 [Saprospiraceae bacterium]|nr:hypothetical protein [Saprospiraceae bacterium]MCF8250016.1 hypothetical protein [Saprospiraceae bacterium]MCF8278944.1 hypothetical protein [Bacteroidales bacterium]MCF8311029.1 hypothetical protein [Saprospiraceae bacterium]MCF8439635.1 hypothetical protein [Saprospiraceae bacterium]
MINNNREGNLYPERELEDLSPEEIVKALQDIGAETGRRAIAEAKALGLPVTFVENDQIIKEFPDGRREVLGNVPPSTKVEIGTVYEVKSR